MNVPFTADAGPSGSGGVGSNSRPVSRNSSVQSFLNNSWSSLTSNDSLTGTGPAARRRNPRRKTNNNNTNGNNKYYSLTAMVCCRRFRSHRKWMQCLVVGWILLVVEEFFLIRHWLNVHDHIYGISHDSNHMDNINNNNNGNVMTASLSASLREYTATASLQLRKSSKTSTTTTAVRPGLHVVVSHCNKPLDWIWERIKFLEEPQLQQTTRAAASPLLSIKSITIYTKCNQPPPIHNNPNMPHSMAQKATVVSLPNVGRCDHSYAYWIEHALQATTASSPELLASWNVTTMPSSLHPQDVVWFVKDNDNSYRQNVEVTVSFPEMLEMVMDSTTTTTGTEASAASPHPEDAHHGFACASMVSPRLGDEIGVPSTVKTTATNWVAALNLGRFRMNKFYHRENYTMGGEAEDDENDENDENEDKNEEALTAEEKLFSSKYKNMQEWIEDLPIQIQLGNKVPQRLGTSMIMGDSEDDENEDDDTKNNSTSPQQRRQQKRLPQLFLPVCYGGQFMTTFQRIQQSPVTNWTQIVHKLSRGDNIEEGHFMERMWAAVLSPPMSRGEQQYIIEQDYSVVKHAGPYKGLILLRNSTRNGTSITEDYYDEPDPSTLTGMSWILYSWFGIKPGKVLKQRTKIIPFEPVVVGYHVVVAQTDCQSPNLDWIWDRMLQIKNNPKNYNSDAQDVIKSITVLTNCNGGDSIVTIPEMIPKLPDPYPVQVMDVPSPKSSTTTTMKHDHAYAYWIANTLFSNHAEQRPKNEGNEKESESLAKTRTTPKYLYHPKDQVVFVKDTDNGVYHRSYRRAQNAAKLNKLLETSHKYGFSCGTNVETDAPPTTVALNVAVKEVVGKFKQLKDWVDNLSKDAVFRNLTLSDTDVTTTATSTDRTAGNFDELHGGNSASDAAPFMPICFGGHFASTIEQIRKAPVVDWNRLAASLVNGNSGDDDTPLKYMERLWAFLLSPPMPTKDQTSLLWNQEYSTVKRPGKYKGVVTIQKKEYPPVPGRKKRGWKEKRDKLLYPWMEQEELLKKYY